MTTYMTQTLPDCIHKCTKKIHMACSLVIFMALVQKRMFLSRWKNIPVLAKKKRVFFWGLNTNMGLDEKHKKRSLTSSFQTFLDWYLLCFKSWVYTDPSFVTCVCRHALSCTRSTNMCCPFVGSISKMLFRSTITWKMQVESESEKTRIEEEECATIAADAQADLDKALPALEKAVNALNAYVWCPCFCSKNKFFGHVVLKFPSTVTKMVFKCVCWAYIFLIFT